VELLAPPLDAALAVGIGAVTLAEGLRSVALVDGIGAVTLAEGLLVGIAAVTLAEGLRSVPLAGSPVSVTQAGILHSATLAPGPSVTVNSGGGHPCRPSGKRCLPRTMLYARTAR